MNAVQIIEEIDAMPADEKSKVVAHILNLEEERFHMEQVKIAEKRLDDLDKGLAGTVSHEKAMRLIREV